jgi:hypothetical protein
VLVSIRDRCHPVDGRPFCAFGGPALQFGNITSGLRGVWAAELVRTSLIWKARILQLLPES